ncbi:hypothetical protein L6164_019490 [Bauhinia variegata]|uniref:Uncharacterized protein n=1 Tax=Bauhinia variegata TaxID=167791 RepID=A0ACB9MTC1_BAUVA|nr:hypothetical protein L6164_019490 [Bauhinia variegata]
MGVFSLTTTPTSSNSFFISRTHLPSTSSSSERRTIRTFRFNQKPNAFTVYASKEESPKLNSDDLMELKFGRLLGEDPKLTLAKIMGRKTNPDASYLDVEKSYYKNKGKFVKVEEVPFDGSKEGKSSSSLDNLGLVRPIKGAKFKSDNKPASEIRKTSQPSNKPVNNTKSSVPNIILRKPTVYNEDDDEEMSSRLRIKPNLSLKIRNGQVKEKFSDMTLLRKPEPSIAKEIDKNQESYGLVDNQVNIGDDLKMRKPDPKIGNLSLSELLDTAGSKTNSENEDQQFRDVRVIAPNDIQKGSKDTSELTGNASAAEKKFGPQYGLTESKQKNDTTGSEQDNQKNLELSRKPIDLRSDLSSVDSRYKLSVETALQGKPKRLDQSTKQTSKSDGEETVFNNPGSQVNTDSGNLANMSDIEINDEAAWARAEDLVKTGERVDVELVSCSTRGFVVSFGSLVGFLPYRNMPAKWKFLAFESWLRKKGLDPLNYRQNLGTITNYDAENRNFVPSSPQYMKIDSKDVEQISSDMKLEDLLSIYDQEKIKFLSSFIDQKIKVNVILADRKLRKLIFSVRPKEKEELIEKKRNLMAKLQVGDIVKCCIQKITYFGIFVEVEEVTALIHQTEVSWDATLDPASYFKIGQVVEAKVLQLDFALDRISLSLKEVMPDPLMESLESVVGDCESLDGRLEVAQTDTEWSEVESLIQELQQIDGIQSVSKGRFFLSPGLAPTFQVYMASIFENQYKLLARSGNRIQEVMVQTSLDKDKMKSAILTCTNKVE